MAYVKLDTGILNSTLWIDRDCRELFITALLMAEPKEFKEPILQLKVDSLEYTGWEAPPGWYGYVPAAGVGIINRCGIDREKGLEGLARLGATEGDSRNPEFEGRRMIRMDGGYVILNYMRYRDKDHTAAKRQQALRDRRKLSIVTRDDLTSRRDVALPSRNVTQSDADADADADAEKKRLRGDTRGEPRAARSAATRIPPDFSMTLEREEYARKQGIDPLATLEAFVDYWTATSGAKARKCDWDATWRTWCRRAEKPRPGDKSVSASAARESAEWREAKARGEAIGFRAPDSRESAAVYMTQVKLAETRMPRQFSVTQLVKRVPC